MEKTGDFSAGKPLLGGPAALGPEAVDGRDSPVCADLRWALPGKWLHKVTGALAGSGWLVTDARECLSQGLLEALGREVRTLDQARAMKRAGIGRGTEHKRDHSVRRDRISWLQGDTGCQKALFGFLEALRTALNRHLFLGLKRFETHYATYHPGDFYRRHLDSFRGRESRIVSLVLYFNDNWQPEDGGLLRIFSSEQAHYPCREVVPEFATMVLFLSEEIPHEVAPARRARYSLACWYRRDEIALPLDSGSRQQMAL